MNRSTLLALAGVVTLASVTYCSAKDEENDESLSSSPLTPIVYWDAESGKDIDTAKTEAARTGLDYVTIEIERVRCHRNSTWLQRWLSKNQNAFASITATADVSDGGTLKSVRLGPIVKLSEEKKTGATIDLNLGGKLLDQIPWTLQKLTLIARVNYTADSTIAGMVNSISGLAQSQPDVTISASVMGAATAAKLIDQLLLGDQRVLSPLNANHVFATGGGKLREGVYVILASDEASEYQKYEAKNAQGASVLRWDGTILLHGTEPVTDVSYFIMRVRLDDRRFSSLAAALSSNSPWAKHLNNAMKDMAAASLESDTEEREGLIKSAKNKINTGYTFLVEDLDMLHSERWALHAEMKDELAKLNTTLAVLTREVGNLNQDDLVARFNLVQSILGESATQQLQASYRALNQEDIATIELQALPTYDQLNMAIDSAMEVSSY